MIPGPIVVEDSKQKNQREKEERKRMQMYLTIQSQEIRELKAEITVLKRKDLPAFSQSLSLNSLAHCPGKEIKVILLLLYPVFHFPSYPTTYLTSLLTFILPSFIICFICFFFAHLPIFLLSSTLAFISYFSLVMCPSLLVHILHHLIYSNSVMTSTSTILFTLRVFTLPPWPCPTGNEPVGPGLPDNLTVVDMSDTCGFEADPDPQSQYSLPPIERKGTTGTGTGTGLF